MDFFLIKNPKGSDDIILCSVLDISARKNAEDELKYLNANLGKMVNEKTRELQDANKNLKKEVRVRKKAENEARKYAKKQTTLMREVNHRVKNNMQIMISLMRLQAKQTRHPDALEAIQESQNRVKALAMIHEALYMAEDLATIPFAGYLKKLSTNIIYAYGRSDIAIRQNIGVKELHIDQALPIGLVLTELLTNSVKYAFPEGSRGEIRINVRLLEEDMAELEVQDNGTGIPDEIDLEKPASLGLHLVKRLSADQLGGQVTIERQPGTRVNIIFPIKKRSEKL